MSFKKIYTLFAALLASVLTISGCTAADGKRIVRIAHAQSETHPDHLGLLEFEKYVEENL